MVMHVSKHVHVTLLLSDHHDLFVLFSFFLLFLEYH